VSFSLPFPQLEKYLPPESKWELIGLKSPSLVSEIVMGLHKVVSSTLVDTPIVGGYTPLSQQFPFILDSFDLMEDDPWATVFSSSSELRESQVYVRDLSLFDLKDLQSTLRNSDLSLDPLQNELNAYLRQQSLPPPWISPFLGKIRSQSVDFDLVDTPLASDGYPSGCGLVGRIQSATASRALPLEIEMGIGDLTAIFASSFVYRHLFSALAIRDYLEATFAISLPLFVLVLLIIFLLPLSDSSSP
jgi:hypothetical protein